MTRSLRALLAPFLVALTLPVALLVAPAAVVAGDPCYHGFELPATTVSTSSEIRTMPCAFAPTITSVPVGTTVTWVNGSDFPHLVTGANQEWGSRDDELPVTGRVSYTFDTAGVYPYACALHRGMVGAIVVGADTAGLGLPPAGDATAGGATPTTAAADPASGTPTGVQIALAAVAGALIALAIAWIARGLRRPVAVKEIG